MNKMPECVVFTIFFFTICFTLDKKINAYNSQKDVSPALHAHSPPRPDAVMPTEKSA